MIKIMIDHTGITVSDYKKSVDLYKKVFGTLGYELFIGIQGYAGSGIKSF